MKDYTKVWAALGLVVAALAVAGALAASGDAAGPGGLPSLSSGNGSQLNAGEVSIDKTADKAVVSPGGDLGYTIALHNGTGSDIAGARVTDTLPLSLAYGNGSLAATNGSYGYSTGVITWTGTLAAGGDVTLTFGADVASAQPSCSYIVNSAVLDAGEDILTDTSAVQVSCQLCSRTKYGGNPVLWVGPPGSWDEGHVMHPAVLKEGDAYKMWYSGLSGSYFSQIGLATSPDGLSWTKNPSYPVLTPTQLWEIGGVGAGSVIADGGGYKMWYTGTDGGGTNRVGYATSPNGINWTHASSPVLDPGAGGAWDDNYVTDPAVLKQGGAYHMWYRGHDGATTRIGHATSADGIAWVKDPANPVLDTGAPGAWDWTNVYGGSAVAVDGGYALWYSGETLPYAAQTGFALSPDGANWTRQGLVIAEGPAGSFDAASADYPSVILDGSTFRIWYSGQSQGGTYRIGYATAGLCGAPLARAVYLPIVLRGTGGQPMCPPYYTDNFSNPGSGWSIADSVWSTLGYVGGQYQILLKYAGLGWWASPGARATDFTAAVSARRVSGSGGGYGFIFGLNDAANEYYLAEIGPNNFRISRAGGGFLTVLQDWTTSSAIRTGTNTNRLKVIRLGSDIVFYANNQQLAKISDGAYTGLRRVGLEAFSPDNATLDVRFDDFAMAPADCGPGAAAARFEMGQPGNGRLGP